MDFSQPMSAISGSNTSLPGRSTNQQKCEQVMFECVQKVAEIIVQSRLAFPRSQIGRKGRVRFNLEIDEVDFLRRLMEPWGMDPHLPLCIDIFWQGQAAAAAATTPHPQHQQQQQQQQPPRALLERWNVTYVPLPSAPGGDALAQLRHVCKRIVILLRTLYSFTRVLPAHQLHRRLQAARAGGRGGSGGGGSGGGGGGGEDIGFCLGVRTGGSGLEFARHVATREYRFEPLDTPYGTLTLATAYRRSLAELCVAPAPPLTAAAPGPLLESDTIIVDYMQQQAAAAAAAAAARPMSGLGAQLHAHGVQRRRHADPGEGFSHSQSPHVGGASSKHYVGSGLGGITEGLAHDRFAQPAPWYRPGTSPVPIPHGGGV